MVSHLFFYQLALLALLWLFVMLHVAWPSSRPRPHQLSSSRLNHWLPRAQAHPEVMQGTTYLHHEITNALLPQPDPVFRDAATLDAAVDMLDPQPTVVQGLVGQLLFQGEFLPSWFLRRHEDLDLGQRKRQEAQIL